MSFLEIAQKRYSVRAYQSRKVEEEKLAKILEAGRIAPTGANRQPHHLIVIQEKDGMERLSKASNIYKAPLAIIICVDRKAAWTRALDGKNVGDIDASIVTDHMMLEATDLGLGSVWICGFKPDVLKKEFSIPDNLEPVNILAIGYAAGEASSPNRHDKTRKPLSNIVTYEALER